MSAPSRTAPYPKSEDGPAPCGRMLTVRDTTVADLAEFCREHGLDPAEVTLASTHLKWLGQETPEEFQTRMAHLAAARERQEAWERETLARLTEKYGKVPW